MYIHWKATDLFFPYQKREWSEDAYFLNQMRKIDSMFFAPKSVEIAALTRVKSMGSEADFQGQILSLSFSSDLKSKYPHSILSFDIERRDL